MRSTPGLLWLVAPVAFLSSSFVRRLGVAAHDDHDNLIECPTNITCRICPDRSGAMDDSTGEHVHYFLPADVPGEDPPECQCSNDTKACPADPNNPGVVAVVGRDVEYHCEFDPCPVATLTFGAFQPALEPPQEATVLTTPTLVVASATHAVLTVPAATEAAVTQAAATEALTAATDPPAPATETDPTLQVVQPSIPIAAFAPPQEAIDFDTQPEVETIDIIIQPEVETSQIEQPPPDNTATAVPTDASTEDGATLTPDSLVVHDNHDAFLEEPVEQILTPELVVDDPPHSMPAPSATTNVIDEGGGQEGEENAEEDEEKVWGPKPGKGPEGGPPGLPGGQPKGQAAKEEAAAAEGAAASQGPCSDSLSKQAFAICDKYCVKDGCPDVLSAAAAGAGRRMKVERRLRGRGLRKRRRMKDAVEQCETLAAEFEAKTQGVVLDCVGEN